MTSEFSSIEEKREWIESVLLEIQLKTASEGEVEQLRGLLLRDRQARQIYLQTQQFDALIESSGGASGALGSAGSSSRIPPSRYWKVLSVCGGLGLAASLVFLLTRFGVRDGDFPEAVGTTPGLAQFYMIGDAVASNVNLKDGDWLEEGVVSLKAGLAQINFTNGTDLVLEGNTELSLIDADTVHLQRGKIWVQCPVEARGFRVLTPNDREIVDLGTEFGVEVGAQGAMNVHVYDGEVRVDFTAGEPRTVVEGKGISWQNEADPGAWIAAETDRFVTKDAILRSREKGYQTMMSERKDLLLYYDFAELEPVKKPVSRVRNKSLLTIGSNDAVVLGGQSVAGRFRDSTAFMMEYEGDGLELQLLEPKESDSLTIAVWVKVDHISEDFAALMNSNGWEPGDLHFQVRENGALLAGVNGGDAFESHSGAVRFGEWHLLAVSWDLEEKQAVLYCDGVRLPSYFWNNRSESLPKVRPRLGLCRIESWGDPDLTLQKIKRDLKGRIDEVMVFNRRLFDKEMGDLHEAGKPYVRSR